MPEAAPSKKTSILSFRKGRGAVLRAISLDLKTVSRAAGSAFFQIGQTKVIAGIYGPHQSKLQTDQGQLKCTVTIAPFSGYRGVDAEMNASHKDRVGTAPAERMLAQQVAHAIRGCVRMERYPKSEIDLFVVVLQDDGGVLPASINAASLALVDAGIEMTGLVSAVHVGYAEGELFVDPAGDEQPLLEGLLLCAATSAPGGYGPGQPYRATNVTSFEVTGAFPPAPAGAPAPLTQALALGLDGCSAVGRCSTGPFCPRARKQRDCDLGGSPSRSRRALGLSTGSASPGTPAGGPPRSPKAHPGRGPLVERKLACGSPALGRRSGCSARPGLWAPARSAPVRCGGAALMCGGAALMCGGAVPMCGGRCSDVRVSPRRIGPSKECGVK
ncbi:putative Exosome complex uclease [Paratrimastix pyriformis]|uniref:Exosome complex uclease n=1 Tax=Paratrimastix pyriformis TaxID=342808 RepID=A0ABQ8UMN3_9EUKA|nr:putative Exosome complex uclease [Paratrimastix pyriformis]